MAVGVMMMVVEVTVVVVVVVTMGVIPIIDEEVEDRIVIAVGHHQSAWTGTPEMGVAAEIVTEIATMEVDEIAMMMAVVDVEMIICARVK